MYDRTLYESYSDSDLEDDGVIKPRVHISVHRAERTISQQKYKELRPYFWGCRSILLNTHFLQIPNMPRLCFLDHPSRRNANLPILRSTSLIAINPLQPIKS